MYIIKFKKKCQEKRGTWTSGTNLVIHLSSRQKPFFPLGSLSNLKQSSSEKIQYLFLKNAVLTRFTLLDLSEYTQ